MKKNLVIIGVVVVVVAAVVWLFATNKSNNNQSATNGSTSSSNSSSDNKAVATTSVAIADMAYSPATITVKKGATVTWKNQDAVAHTVTADDSSLSMDSGSVAQGGTFKFTFSQAGTFKYHCTFHSNMHGTVIVTE